MKVEIVKVGELECNCYLLDIDGCLLVIDPGDDGDKIINKIGDRKVLGIIITHHHFDHVGAIDDLVYKYNCLVYDVNNLIEGENKIGEFEFLVIGTPGHKEDAITIYFEKEKMMFCGDFIFKGNIGRCDLPGGNVRDMVSSINKIKLYDRDIVIYPGHGDKTTLGFEIDNNIYFQNINYL